MSEEMNFDVYSVEQNRMISWLKKQSTRDFHAAATHLNWDYAMDVLEWIVDQPTTQAATALELFFMAEPTFYLPRKLSDGTIDREEPLPKIISVFANRWSEDGYAKNGIGLDPVAIYGNEIKEIETADALFRDSGMMPWPKLEGLSKPLAGKSEYVSVFDLHKEDQAESFRIRALFEDLGTRPMDDGSDQTHYVNWRIANGFGPQPRWKTP